MFQTSALVHTASNEKPSGGLGMGQAVLWNAYSPGMHYPVQEKKHFVSGDLLPGNC